MFALVYLRSQVITSGPAGAGKSSFIKIVEKSKIDMSHLINLYPPLNQQEQVEQPRLRKNVFILL